MSPNVFLFKGERKLMATRHVAGRVCHHTVAWEGTGVNDV